MGQPVTFQEIGKSFSAPAVRPAARVLPSDQRAAAHRPDMVAGDFRVGCARSSGMEAQLMDAAHLFADARSTPPRVAAVLFARGSIWYTDWEPDAAILRLFHRRSDNQIMSLELLAIAVAMSSFRHLLPCTAIEIFSDNRGAEKALARGSARHFDHACLVHGMWAMAAEFAASVWVHRVPSSENIADAPSREDYGLVRRLEAKFVEPVLDGRFYAPHQWASLASAR